MNEHKIVCDWCGEVLVEGPEPTTGGICEECRPRLIEELKRVKGKKGEGDEQRAEGTL